MSLKPCRECKKEVSNKAKTCPHCGIKWPGRKESRLGILLIVLLIMIFLPQLIIGLAYKGKAVKEVSEPAPPPTQAEPARLPEQISESMFYLQKQEKHLLPTLLAGARKIWTTNAECLQVTDGDLRPRDKQERGNPAFYVTCKTSTGYENYYFTKNDVDQGHDIHLRTPPSKELAINQCRKHIRNQLHFPSSYQEDAATDLVANRTSGNRRVRIDFVAKNGFGIEIPQQAECTIDSEGKFDGIIAAR